MCVHAGRWWVCQNLLSNQSSFKMASARQWQLVLQILHCVEVLNSYKTIYTCYSLFGNLKTLIIQHCVHCNIDSYDFNCVMHTSLVPRLHPLRCILF